MSSRRLPARCANPYIESLLKANQLPPVKYQILNCQGQDILVGRLKIETPTTNGHAFILRRFDTNAISLTTMFRAAFPSASESDEKAEVQWVKDTYDLAGNNGSSREPHLTRLAGVWVSPTDALEVAHDYGFREIIQTMVEAAPDPTANYRRSGKNAAAAEPVKAPASPSPKRRREASPVRKTETPASRVMRSSSPAKTVARASKPMSAAKPVPSTKSANTSPTKSVAVSPDMSSTAKAHERTPTAVRRSTRMKSPVPASLTPVRAKPVSIKPTVSNTPGGSEETVVAEEEEEGENGTVESDVAGSALIEQDIQEQQELIAGLKAKRDALKWVEKDEDMNSGVSVAGKRRREDEKVPLRFDFKEPEIQDRVVATNRRVSATLLEPRTKSFAWGVAAFVVGMSAVSFIPNFF